MICAHQPKTGQIPRDEIYCNQCYMRLLLGIRHHSMCNEHIFNLYKKYVHAIEHDIEWINYLHLLHIS
jgi:hypothetical protein